MTRTTRTDVDPVYEAYREVRAEVGQRIETVVTEYINGDPLDLSDRPWYAETWGPTSAARRTPTPAPRETLARMMCAEFDLALVDELTSRGVDGMPADVGDPEAFAAVDVADAWIRANARHVVEWADEHMAKMRRMDAANPEWEPYDDTQHRRIKAGAERAWLAPES